MAKENKKESELTIEEKMQSVLVPKDEQPYELPENWSWMFLDKCAGIKTGKKDANYGTEDGKYLFFTCASEPLHANGYSFDCEALILAGNGDISNIFLYNGKFEAYQRTYVVQINEPLSIKYVYYYFKYNWVDYNKEKMFGSTIPYIRLGNLKEYPIPWAPLEEQLRIVDCIDSLFSQLDEAKEKVQEVIDGFDSRRAAILHSVFNGELTKRWREEKNVGADTWKSMSINSVCTSLKYGTSKKSEKSGKVVVIRMGNLQRGEIDWGDVVYTSDDNEIEKYALSNGDVLFNRTNSAELVGKTSIYRGEYPAIYAGYLIKLDYDREILNGDFFNYILNSPEAREYCNSVKTDAVNQSNINAKKIGAFVIPIPSLDEQIKIAKIAHELLEVEEKAYEAAQTSLAKIEDTKKAILSKAFRGELGTNDSSDEPAEELLKTVLSEASVEEKKKSTTRKTKVKVVMNKDMLEAVREAGKITPERLKEETGLGIDDFYEELKRLTESGQVSEKKEGGDVYLEVRDAN